MDDRWDEINFEKLEQKITQNKSLEGCDPFEVFQISEVFDLDLDALRRRYFVLCGNYFGVRSDILFEINLAYQILKNPIKRLDAIIKKRKGPVRFSNIGALPDEIVQLEEQYESLLSEHNKVLLEVYKKHLLKLIHQSYKRIEKGVVEKNFELLLKERSILSYYFKILDRFWKDFKNKVTEFLN